MLDAATGRQINWAIEHLPTPDLHVRTPRPRTQSDVVIVPDVLLPQVVPA
jgi:hypothetical protein